MPKTFSLPLLMRSALSCLFALALAVGAFPSEALAAQESESTALEENDASALVSYDAQEMLEREHEDGELIVVYDEDAADSVGELVSDACALSDVLENDAVEIRDEVCELPEGQTSALVSIENGSKESMAEAMRALSAVEGVAYVEPNYTYSLSETVPNDPYAGANHQYYLKSGGITSMWDSAKAQDNVTVAVIDSGCNMSHPDLVDRVDRENAYDVVSGKNLASARVANNGDSYGHGTNVCGVIAAQADNGEGIAGTSWNAKIIPVRIFDSSNRVSLDMVLSALEYVDELIEGNKVSNLRVLNMSFGGEGSSKSLQSLLEHLYTSHGVLNVAAGGNGDEFGRPITSYTYPSDYNSCFSVTSTDREGANSTWCDYNRAKDLSAPGEQIWTTTKAGSWGNMETYVSGRVSSVSGTSFSAPIVAGAAAAMLARHPNASAYDIAKAMQSTASSVPGQPSASGSKGALSAGAATAFLASHITGSNPASGLGTVVDFSDKGIAMYRMYNRITGEHLYTANAVERDLLRRGDWNYEGVGWTAPSSGNPVYRLYNPGLGDHHYTMGYGEMLNLVQYHGWNYEGIGWYSGGSTPLYRQYNPGLRVGQHHYTSNTYERDQNARYHGWRNEGIGWYAIK